MLSDNSPQCDVSHAQQSNQRIPPSFERVKQYDRNFPLQQPQKYFYNENQWSPLNPEGKRQYDRDFLLQLQSGPLSLIKPTNLPNLNIVKDKPHIQKLYKISKSAPLPKTTNLHDDLLPTFGDKQVNRMLEEQYALRLGPRRAMANLGRNDSCKTKAPYSPDLYKTDKTRSTTMKISSTESSHDRDGQLLPDMIKNPSPFKERCNQLEAVKSLVKEGTALEIKEAGIKKASMPQLNELRLRGVELNEELMEEKTKPLINEFLHNNDYEEAIRCITELASPNTIHMFINSAILQVLERSDQARHDLGKLIFSLVKNKIITFDQYKKGFTYVLEFVDEFALDIPLVRDYVWGIIEPMLEDNYPLTFLKRYVKLEELWSEFNLPWTDFSEENADADKYIHKRKLEFTVRSGKAKPNILEVMKKHLLELLDKTEESEEIFDWVYANISANKEPGFIRALVSAVLENAIKDSGTGCELDVRKLKKRMSVLSFYIDHNENLELQALYAIQSLMNQLNQPKGILRQIFEILYDEDVVTEETFKNWERSGDANEVEGKEEALHSVENFFKYLKETESSDSVSDDE